MKSQVAVVNENIVLDFPRLMRYNHNGHDIIVMMLQKLDPFNGIGVVVHSFRGLHKLGEYSETWNLRDFEDYDQGILLQN